MDVISAKEVATTLALLGSLIDILGAEGIIGLVFGSPILMVLAFALQSFLSGRRLHLMFEEARKNINDLWEKHREEISRLQEDHRRESAAILKELGEGLGKTTRYYEDNVKLVEDYSKLADKLQDLVTSNIRTQEKVSAGIDALCTIIGNK